MGYHPRIETTKIATHISSRTRNSVLWFVNNEKLEKNILGIVAKAITKREVKLYALAIQGNHIHQSALFPKANRADYTRDVNSSVAKAAARQCTKNLSFTAKRYSTKGLTKANSILLEDKNLKKS